MGFHRDKGWSTFEAAPAAWWATRDVPRGQAIQAIHVKVCRRHAQAPTVVCTFSVDLWGGEDQGLPNCHRLEGSGRVGWREAGDWVDGLQKVAKGGEGDKGGCRLLGQLILRLFGANAGASWASAAHGCNVSLVACMPPNWAMHLHQPSETTPALNNYCLSLTKASSWAPCWRHLQRRNPAALKTRRLHACICACTRPFRQRCMHAQLAPVHVPILFDNP